MLNVRERYIRDTNIQRAFGEGASTRTIANLTGLSLRRTQEVIQPIRWMQTNGRKNP